MKNTKFAKRILIFATAIVIIASCCLLASCQLFCGELEGEQSSVVGLIDTRSPITEKSLKLYRDGLEEKISLGFFDGICDLPMISLESAVALLNDHVQNKRDGEYSITVNADGNRLTLLRDNGSYAVVDFDEGTLYFDDYNRFNSFSFELGSLDILESDGFNDNGEPEYFDRVAYSEKKGESSLIDLSERGIPAALQNGKGYIALQTFSDIFLTPHEIMICYNGEAAYLLNGNLLGDLSESYYAENDRVRSAELIDVNYRSLCLLVDFHYGLYAERGINCADDYFAQIGLKDELNSADTAEYFAALKTLVYKFFSDNHSGVLMHSPYDPSPNYSLGVGEFSVGYQEFYKKYQLYSSKRQAQSEGGLQPYYEIGNTAFITFDAFSSATVDYYENDPTDGEFYDEIGLICYAHAMINREDSPIENVVIDLATNTGGHMDGGIFLVSWVLGEGIMHITDPIRHSDATSTYRADVNLDREFDERDTISDKNVYLITSPITFSCANYVASALKESGRVTVLGSTSGGGTCCVYMASTADGAAICLSSTLRMSGYKNGTYYSIDAGIAPDVKITNINHFFDQNKLYEIIQSLQ